MIEVDLSITSRWHSWIAQPPPKGQVGGSNPLRDANIINELKNKTLFQSAFQGALRVHIESVYKYYIFNEYIRLETE